MSSIYDSELIEYAYNISNFKRIYQDKINSFVNKIKRQMRNIVDTDDIIIDIAPSGTSMTINIKENDTYNVILTIGYEEMIKLMENSKYDLFTSFCKLVTHEYLHVLCGHFDEKVQYNIFRFVHLGNYKIKYNFFERRIENLIAPFIVNNTKSYKINNEINYTILNVAGDLEINHLINMPDGPFLKARDTFGLPEGLSTIQYYAIIYYTLISLPKDELKFEDFSSTGENNFIADYFIKSRNKIINFFKYNAFKLSLNSNNDDDGNGNGNIKDDNINDEEENEFSNIILDKNDFEAVKYAFSSKKYEQAYENSKFSDKKGNLPGCAQKMTCSRSGIWKEFNDILNELSSSTEMKLSFIDRYDSWTKFNNRKEGDFLYPGKREKLGSTERKIDSSYVIFVDVSASMSEVIDPLFSFCYFALEKLNIRFVFYDTKIVKIFDKSDDIELEPFVAGGTSAYSAVHEYCEKFKKPTKVFIISDCCDDYDKLINEFNVKIWQVKGMHITPYI